MKSTNQVLGLPVMGIQEGKMVGEIVDIIASAKTKNVEQLLVSTEDSRLPLILNMSDVVSIGESFVLVKSVEMLSKIYRDAETIKIVEEGIYLLDLGTVMGSGDEKGKIVEVEFDEKSGAISKLILDDESVYGKDDIVCLTTKFAFFGDVPGLGFLTPVAETEAAAAPAQAVAAVPEVEVVAETVAAPVVETVVEAVVEPVVETVVEPVAEPVEEPVVEEPMDEALKESISYLMGKTLNDDVASDDGSFEIKKGTVLTKELIVEAYAQDVIPILTLNVD